MKLAASTFATAFGPFSLAVDATGALVATAFGPLAALGPRLGECTLFPDTDAGAPAREQIAAYLAGRRDGFALRLAPRGTPFQQRVWSALLAIPRGETRRYGEIAAQLGQPGAARAIGRANATNPLCLVIPCHRVIGADGQLTGFAFGEQIKGRLLALEGARLTPAAA